MVNPLARMITSAGSFGQPEQKVWEMEKHAPEFMSIGFAQSLEMTIISFHENLQPQVRIRNDTPHTHLLRGLSNNTGTSI
jgi:hypothetical protein